MPHVRQFACVTDKFVDSTVVIFLLVVLWFLFRELFYCVCASEGYANVCALEVVCQFSYPWPGECEDCPFFGFVFVPFVFPSWVSFLYFFNSAAL